MIEHITRCRACDSTEIEPFFDLGMQPFANSLLKTGHSDEKLYPLSLSWCSSCNLVQLNQTAKPEELFSEYVWVTGTSSSARVYSERFCESVLQHASAVKDRDYILEVASNDGTFLKPFINRGFKVLGVDPAENIVKSACAEGIPTKCGFFGRSIAGQVVGEHGYPKAVMVRNVLPHVAYLHDFMEGIRLCLDDDGLLVLEVHYAKVILDELHYDSIYHEHLCYFSFKSVEQLLNSYNLHVYDIMESPISGGSIVLFVKKRAPKESDSVQAYRESERKSLVNGLRRWQAFASESFMHKDMMLAILKEEAMEKGVVVGYGASARSSTMLNFCNIDTRYISMIADQNPLKHKLLTPGTHIPIGSPDTVMKENPDTVLVLAWNFLREITDRLVKDYNFKGKLIVPFPNPPKIVNIQEVSG